MTQVRLLRRRVDRPGCRGADASDAGSAMGRVLGAALSATITTTIATTMAVGFSVALGGAAAADAPPHIVVAATPLALMTADITKGVTSPETIDLVRLAKVRPLTMRKALNNAKLLIWIGPFHLPRLVPVLAGQTSINSLALFDVRGVRLMGLPEPVKPGVKPDPPQIKLKTKTPVASRRRQISASDLHHKYPDPYIWLDPRNGIAMVRAITVRLSAIDPANGRLYRRNSAALVSQLEALDQEIQVRVVPLRRIAFVSLDRSFQYFERQYNLDPKLRLHDSNSAMTAAEAAAAHRKLSAKRYRCVIMPTTAAHGATVVKGVKLRVAWIDPYGRDLRKRGGYAAFLRSVAERYMTCLTGRRPPTR